MPLLQTLARHDKNAYVKLLEEGADPNKCDRIGSCAMNQAAREDDPYWLRTALAHGEDPNVINERNPYYPNSTPIFYAISKERPVNAKILVEAGANINHQDGFGETPLRKAAGTGVYETVVLLLEAGADPYLADRHGYSLVNWFNGRDESMVPDKSRYLGLGKREKFS